MRGDLCDNIGWHIFEKSYNILSTSLCATAIILCMLAIPIDFEMNGTVSHSAVYRTWNEVLF